MLCVGSKPGVYIIKVLNKGTTSEISESKYQVTDTWDGELAGPPLWFSDTGDFRFAGSAWGGGSGWSSEY